MNDVVASLVGFGHALRREGVPVGAGRIRTFCEAAAALAPDDLYWAGRASLLWRPEHIAVYDDAFRRYFGATADGLPDEQETLELRPTVAQVRSVGEGEETSTGTAEGTASPAELLHDKSFAECTPDEWAELAVLLSRLPQHLPVRRTRRYQPGRPGDMHVRRVLRSAASTGGEPFKLRERRRRLRLRPLIFLLDVSGSMTAYSRGLLLFAHAVLRNSPDTEVYAFGTRLTRLTTALATPSLEGALRASESIVPDWDGGTRIGDALAGFLAARGRHAQTRRAIAVICSDGLDTGDPVLLGEQAGRLRRAAHRVVWLNPLKEDPRYEPLARGMQAALPYVDVFESGHSVASLLAVLDRLGHRRLAVAHRMLYTRPAPRSRREDT
jgi:uncharacterized protein with von Willebrand factor type A (vWA) domain